MNYTCHAQSITEPVDLCERSQHLHNRLCKRATCLGTPLPSVLLIYYQNLGRIDDRQQVNLVLTMGVNVLKIGVGVFFVWPGWLALVIRSSSGKRNQKMAASRVSSRKWGAFSIWGGGVVSWKHKENLQPPPPFVKFPAFVVSPCSCQFWGKVLTRELVSTDFPESKAQRDWFIWIFPEIHVDEWLPNLSESSGHAGIGP